MPNASLEEVFATAARYRCDFVELRILDSGEELRRYWEQQGPPPTPIRVLGSSFRLTSPTEAALQTFEAIAELATLCNVPYVRVFGGGEFTPHPLPLPTLQIAAATIRRCEDSIRDKNLACQILVETHDSLSAPDDCLRLNDLLDRPLTLLWDSHHTWRLAGESPGSTWSKISSLVRHVHFKDSTSISQQDNTFRYVNPGQGEFPADELFAALKAGNYQHGISLEWEKMWHPELPPIDEALTAFRSLSA